jgi:hypothetical protein
MAALALIGRLWLAILDEDEEVDEAQQFPSFAVLDDDHGDNVMVERATRQRREKSSHWWKKGLQSRFVKPISPGCSNRD